jgi:hypothetical protein
LAPFAIEMRAEQQEAGQVELAFGDALEEFRKLPDEPGRFRTPIGLVFTHSKLVHAIGIERSAGALAMDPTRFYLSKMREQVSKPCVRSGYNLAHAREKLIVGDCLEFGKRQHVPIIHL